MPPGTLHIVFTVDPDLCICTGNHFYPKSTMAKSVFTIYQNLVLSSWITNVPVGGEYAHLLRIIVFWKEKLVDSEEQYFQSLEAKDGTLAHVPDLNIMDDLINLLALLNFADLAWVLTPVRYIGRRKMPTMYETAKDAADQVRSWLYSTFKLVLRAVKGKEEDRDCGLRRMSDDYLLQHACLLVRHMENASADGYRSENIALSSNAKPKYLSSELVSKAIETDLCIPGTSFEKGWNARVEEDRSTVEHMRNLRKDLARLAKSNGIGFTGALVGIKEDQLEKLKWKGTGNTYAWPQPEWGFKFVLELSD